jgi:hypothetical protein
MKHIHQIKLYFFHYNTPRLQNQTQFHQMTNKYNFSKFQTNSNMCKSYIHITNFSRKKNYKTSKHTNKLHILHKRAK